MITFKNVYSSRDFRHLYTSSLSGHFFAPDTMRFFRSRLLDHLYKKNDKLLYFVTSERYGSNAPRLYTIRRARIVSKRIDISTLSDARQISYSSMRAYFQSLKGVRRTLHA